MSQSNKIFGVIVLAFVIYITLRGQLAAYIDVFTSSAPAKTGGTNTATNPANTEEGGLGNYIQQGGVVGQSFKKVMDDFDKIIGQMGI